MSAVALFLIAPGVGGKAWCLATESTFVSQGVRLLHPQDYRHFLIKAKFVGTWGF